MVVLFARLLAYPLHLQMVVILQPAPRRPFSMIPVTIFTAIMNQVTKNTKSSLLVPSLYIQAQQRREDRLYLQS